MLTLKLKPWHLQTLPRTAQECGMHHARLQWAEEDIINMLGWKLPPLVLPSFIVSERTHKQSKQESLSPVHTPTLQLWV